MALALAFTVSSCGDDSKPKESEAESKAELAKLPKSIEDEFRAGDKNNDLRIQDTELEAMLMEAATVADVDKDREITEAEIRLELGKDGDAKASLSMLFPGDAQIENWQFTLDKLDDDPDLRTKLAGIDLYKSATMAVGTRRRGPCTLSG